MWIRDFQEYSLLICICKELLETDHWSTDLATYQSHDSLATWPIQPWFINLPTDQTSRSSFSYFEYALLLIIGRTRSLLQFFTTHLFPLSYRLGWIIFWYIICCHVSADRFSFRHLYAEFRRVRIVHRCCRSSRHDERKTLNMIPSLLPMP